MTEKEALAWNALLFIENGMSEEMATHFAEQWNAKCSLLAAAEARNEIARKALDNSDWSDARRIHEATLALRSQSSGGGNG